MSSETTSYIEKPLGPFWVSNPSNPKNVLVFLSFLSPAIIACATLGLSFVLQTFQGFIFLAFLLGCCLLRSIFFVKSDIYESLDGNDTKPVCNAIKYTNVGNNTFSVFVSCFTLAYMCVPMFMNNNINWWLFTALLCYICFDVGVKIVYECIEKKNGVQLGLDILSGVGFAVMVTVLMMSGGSGKYLFFSNQPSDKAQCNVPKSQQFKCAVYKNGQLVTNI